MHPRLKSFLVILALVTSIALPFSRASAATAWCSSAFGAPCNTWTIPANNQQHYVRIEVAANYASFYLKDKQHNKVVFAAKTGFNVLRPWTRTIFGLYGPAYFGHLGWCDPAFSGSMTITNG